MCFDCRNSIYVFMPGFLMREFRRVMRYWLSKSIIVVITVEDTASAAYSNSNHKCMFVLISMLYREHKQFFNPSRCVKRLLKTVLTIVRKSQLYIYISDKVTSEHLHVSPVWHECRDSIMRYVCQTTWKRRWNSVSFVYAVFRGAGKLRIVNTFYKSRAFFAAFNQTIQLQPIIEFSGFSAIHVFLKLYSAAF